MDQNDQYLKLLSIFHYVVGGISLLFACFPVFHLIIGITMMVSSITEPSEEATPLIFMGAFFTLIAGTFIVIGWIFGICLILAGRFLATRTRYTFCLVMAGLACLFMPFGTVLGIFTIILLVQPQVKAQFEGQPAPPELVGPA